LLRAPPLPPAEDVEAGEEEVVEERTELGVEVEEGGLVEVVVGVEIEAGVLVWLRELTGTKELLLPGTVETEEPGEEPTELEAEQSVANKRWV
jgi:hypothetical protein